MKRRCIESVNKKYLSNNNSCSNKSLDNATTEPPIQYALSKGINPKNISANNHRLETRKEKSTLWEGLSHKLIIEQ